MITIDFLRQFRIGEYAIFDFSIAFIGIYLFSPLLSKLFLKLNLDIPKLSWVYFTIPISIISHLLVGNITPMTRNFFDVNSHYILKIVVISLIILGIRKIKIVKMLDK